MCKNCVKHVAWRRKSRVKFMSFVRRLLGLREVVFTTRSCTHFCTQQIKVHLHSFYIIFTPVIFEFSTLSTPPTKTTTIYINN